MKILHISTSDMGGAGIAAYRLNAAMVRNGVDSSILVLRKNKSSSIETSKIDARIFSYMRYHTNNFLVRNASDQFGIFTYPLFGSSIVKHPAILSSDIIYIHWVLGGFLSLSEISRIFKSCKRIIIFMHDMWFITGGCHYSFSCDKYENLCYDCQVFNKHKIIDLSKLQFKIKRRLFKKADNISVVAPSKWLTNCVKDSLLLKDKNIAYIPNTLDSELFRKVDKPFARKFLNLPTDKKIICFGANGGIENPVKGWNYLEEALKLLKHENIEVLIFGADYSNGIEERIPFRVHFTGKLSDEYSLGLVYNAIDLFITPSLAENAPQVVIESMICGVPVVGFNIGGIPELVIHKETGYLAKYKDVKDLAKGIRYVLFEAEHDYLSANAIKMASFLSNENRIVNLHRELW